MFIQLHSEFSLESEHPGIFFLWQGPSINRAMASGQNIVPHAEGLYSDSRL
jgi:hypothetical protein